MQVRRPLRATPVPLGTVSSVLLGSLRDCIVRPLLVSPRSAVSWTWARSTSFSSKEASAMTYPITGSTRRPPGNRQRSVACLLIVFLMVMHAIACGSFAILAFFVLRDFNPSSYGSFIPVFHIITTSVAAMVSLFVARQAWSRP